MASGGDRALGYRVLKLESDRVQGLRKTRESEVSVEIDLRERDPELKDKIRTPYQFFNHMLETLAWRACMNMALSITIDGYHSSHVVCEDMGLTVGESLKLLWEESLNRGINGSGWAVSCIDDGLSRAMVSFENRSKLFFTHSGVTMPERVEDMLTTDLVQFLDGLSQGGRLTLHLDVLKGNDPHHIWESAFRALGESLRMAFQPNEWRKGTTPGVKGL